MWTKKFKELNCSVVIPTYNNQNTLSGVIDSVLEYTDRIIVVNDGATDKTEEILERYSQITVVKHESNKGKGVALRTGFKKALELGYRYVITIDSDGQHNPDELPAFLEKIESEHDSLIVGARNMEQSSVPGKSSFGHKFSNFWYKVETGIDLPDTQSGYRLYPVEKLKGMKFFTNKFEFEIEVIVRAAWRGINVTSVPVSVVYFPKETRVTHFRPVRDFTRVSILNTILVFLAFTIFRPLMYLRNLRKKSFKEIRADILGTNDPVHIVAASVGFGVFMGVSPLWGFQILIALAVSHLLKLNKALVIFSAHISLPPLIPFIIYFSYILGGVFFESSVELQLDNITLESIYLNFIQYATGAFMLGILLAAVFSPVTYIYVALRRKKKLS
jgi:glycosyltransferase involved in cell wall biosynthesis